ncbi:hypothetical protein [Prosthecobacter sp.]|uniref:hypothetical protein n=1 Tax=Prosthecobacter sp. TaxID=1965333 RepID=UPI0037848962
MPRAKSLRRPVIVLVTVLLGATLSTLLQVFVLQDEVPLYQSVGRLAAKSPSLQQGSGSQWQKQTRDFHGAIIETLESGEMKRRAMTKLFASAPDLASCEVRVEVSLLRNSDVIKVITTSEDPRAVSIFLDSLLEEFIDYREAAGDEKSEKLDTITIQQHASPAKKVLGEWREAAFSGALTGGLAGLMAGLLLAFAFVRPADEIPAVPAEEKAPSLLAASRLLIFGVAMGAVSGLLIQIVRLTSRPQEFRSLAKVVRVQGLNPEKMAGHRVSDDYDGTIIETLESPQMLAAAMKRVKASNPEVRDLDVDVRVAQTKGSAIFNVLATGGEPGYTRIFLNALLDEFMILRTRQAEEAGLDPRKDVAIQERATPASENVEDWNMPLAAGSANGACVGGLLGFLAKTFSRRRQTTPQADLAS